MLLFICFNRILHFVYVPLDAMLYGFFSVTRLPADSTFWPSVDSLGINQAKSLLNVMSILRDRVWQLCGFTFYRVLFNIDATVNTIYGNQQGACKSHYPKHRGKQSLRHLLGFIEETREYLVGKRAQAPPKPARKPIHLLPILKTTCPAAFRKCWFVPTGSFYPGKVLKPRWKPDLTLSLPIKAAPRFLTPTSGINTGNEKL